MADDGALFVFGSAQYSQHSGCFFFLVVFDSREVTVSETYNSTSIFTCIQYRDVKNIQSLKIFVHCFSPICPCLCQSAFSPLTISSVIPQQVVKIFSLSKTSTIIYVFVLMVYAFTKHCTTYLTSSLRNRQAISSSECIENWLDKSLLNPYFLLSWILI